MSSREVNKAGKVPTIQEFSRYLTDYLQYQNLFLPIKPTQIGAWGRYFAVLAHHQKLFLPISKLQIKELAGTFPDFSPSSYLKGKTQLCILILTLSTE